jgi:hypothetical protein
MYGKHTGGVGCGIMTQSVQAGTSSLIAMRMARITKPQMDKLSSPACVPGGLVGPYQVERGQQGGAWTRTWGRRRRQCAWVVNERWTCRGGGGAVWRGGRKGERERWGERGGSSRKALWVWLRVPATHHPAQRTPFGKGSGSPFGAPEPTSPQLGHPHVANEKGFEGCCCCC